MSEARSRTAAGAPGAGIQPDAVPREPGTGKRTPLTKRKLSSLSQRMLNSVDPRDTPERLREHPARRLILAPSPNSKVVVLADSFWDSAAKLEVCLHPG